MFVRLWMSRDPIALLPSQTVAEAASLMRERRIRHLPVVDVDKKLIGIVSAYDIADIQPPAAANASDRAAHLGQQTALSLLPVERIMSRQPISASPLTPIETVAQQMRRHKLGGMPVVDEDGKLIGVFTESDLCSACMTMLGGGGGTRVDLLFAKEGRRVLVDILNLCQRHGVTVLACVLHRNYSDSQQLLTLRLIGDGLTDLLADLPGAGAAIYQLLEEEA